MRFSFRSINPIFGSPDDEHNGEVPGHWENRPHRYSGPPVDPATGMARRPAPPINPGSTLADNPASHESRVRAILQNLRGEGVGGDHPFHMSLDGNRAHYGYTGSSQVGGVDRGFDATIHSPRRLARIQQLMASQGMDAGPQTPPPSSSLHRLARPR